MLTITEREVDTLRTALYDAIRWEQTFLDAIREPFTKEFRPRQNMKRVWKKSQNNIRKYHALLKRIRERRR